MCICSIVPSEIPTVAQKKSCVHDMHVSLEGHQPRVYRVSALHTARSVLINWLNMQLVLIINLSLGPITVIIHTLSIRSQTQDPDGYHIYKNSWWQTKGNLLQMETWEFLNAPEWSVLSNEQPVIYLYCIETYSQHLTNTQKLHSCLKK